METAKSGTRPSRDLELSIEADGQSGQRLGVLGGTFDPVHLGHLAVADYAFSSLSLDQIIFIPAARPPHKPDLKITPFHHRVSMLELAVEDRPDYIVSPIEESRTGPSYSIDTLKELRCDINKNDQILFLIGIDAFTEIDTWKDFRFLPDLCDIVVIDRADHPIEMLEKTIGIFGSFSSLKGNCWISTEHTGRICFLPMEPVAISSTSIRERLKNGDSVDDFVPHKIVEYIKYQGFYV